MGIVSSLAAANVALVLAKLRASDHVLACLQPVAVKVGLAEALAEDALLLENAHLWLGGNVSRSAAIERVGKRSGHRKPNRKSASTVLGVVLGIASQNRVTAAAAVAFLRSRVGHVAVRRLAALGVHLVPPVNGSIDAAADCVTAVGHGDFSEGRRDER